MLLRNIFGRFWAGVICLSLLFPCTGQLVKYMLKCVCIVCSSFTGLAQGAGAARFDPVLGTHCKLLEWHVGFLALVTLWSSLVYCLQFWSSRYSGHCLQLLGLHCHHMKTAGSLAEQRGLSGSVLSIISVSWELGYLYLPFNHHSNVLRPQRGVLGCFCWEVWKQLF